MRTLVQLIFLLLSALPLQGNADDNLILNTWVELGPRNQTIVRAITKDSICPTLIINKTYPLPMTTRAVKSKAFAVTTCETTIPADAVNVEINNQSLRLPKKNPQRIAVLGDTGCRLKWGVPPQACNDPNKWPFKKIIAQVTKLNPDLVIHLGDYHYRELACPKFAKGCTDSPYGYNWPTWQADFFNPAKKLLIAAPWIFVRGNHEDCERAWRGWFRFLDPDRYSTTCQIYTKPYFVRLNNLTLIVMDSSKASDFTAPKKEVAIYTKYFSDIKNSKLQNLWLLTHKPVWSIADSNETIKPYSTLQKAIHKNLPEQLNLIFSGHIHRFQTLNFTNKRPTQIITGNGGTRLDTEIIETLVHSFFVENSKLGKDVITDHFGFLLLEQTADGWQAQEYNADGKTVVACKLNQKQFICKN